MAMDIKLDDAALKGIISEAILARLDETTRDAIFKAAIEHLLKSEQTYSGGPHVSPIERAFRDAVINVAHQTAVDMVTKDPVMVAKIQGVMADAAARVLADPEKLTAKIEGAIRQALTGDRY